MGKTSWRTMEVTKNNHRITVESICFLNPCSDKRKVEVLTRLAQGLLTPRCTDQNTPHIQVSCPLEKSTIITG